MARELPVLIDVTQQGPVAVVRYVVGQTDKPLRLRRVLDVPDEGLPIASLEILVSFCRPLIDLGVDEGTAIEVKDRGVAVMVPDHMET